MTPNSIVPIVHTSIQIASGSALADPTVHDAECHATPCGRRARRGVWSGISRALGLAAAALLLLSGTVTSASAANKCVNGGVVAGTCTLDANFTGTITLVSNSTLDCRGLYKITGNLVSSAIVIQNARYVTVKNCGVQDASVGIRIDNSRYITLESNTLTSNAFGVFASNSADITMTDGAVSMNAHGGLVFNNSYNINVQEVYLLNNDGEGISLNAANNVKIDGVRVFGAANNEASGIWASNSSYLSIVNSFIRGWNRWGVSLNGGTTVHVQFNTFSLNHADPSQGFSDANIHTVGVRSLTTTPNTYY